MSVEIKTIPEIYLDNCVLSHSITEPNSLPPNHHWLKQQIPAIRKITDLCKQGKLKVTHGLDVALERTRYRDKYDEIRKIWKDCLPNPLGGPSFVGPVSVNGKIFKDKPLYEKRLLELRKKINDQKLDPSHLINAELYGVYAFITTDNILINKVRNNCKGFLGIKVLSPSEFIEEYNNNG